jgi:hypothetical protein
VESTSQMTDVAHVIQVAVAPVFLLSGIGGMLAVVITRLGRIVDRSRLLDDRLASADPAGKAALRGELANLTRRSRLIDRAIVLATAAGFFVCLVIFTLFVEYLAKLRMSALVASLFLLAMLCLIGAFGTLQREVLLASSPLRHEQWRAARE